MRMVLKFFYLLLIWAVITAVCAGGSYVINAQDIQPGLRLAGILFLLWVAWRILRLLFIRYRARARAMHLANFEDPTGEAAQQSWWQSLQARFVRPGIDARFQAVIKFLTGSELGRHQDPKYALPWFIVLGSEKAGADAVLEAANVGKPSIDQREFNSPDFDTRFWPTNNGIFVSASPTLVTQNARMDEWQRLLQLLLKKRPANPINGFVLALSFDELQTLSSDELREMGLAYRKRIDEAMRVTGVQMPVYLQLTGADTLKGMPELIGYMDDAERDQFFGVLNRDNITSENFVDRFITDLSETVQQRALGYLLQENEAHKLIELPSLIRSCEGGLTAFVNACFQTSAFQATPEIRGASIAALVQEDEQFVRPAFVRVFIDVILAAENRLAGILPEAEQRKRQARQGAYVAYVAAIALVMVGLGVNYSSHKSYVDNLFSQYAGAIVERQDTYLNIEVFFDLQTAINELDRRFWMPWMTTPTMVKTTKLDYVNRSGKSLFNKMDDTFEANAVTILLADVNNERSDLMSSYVNSLIAQINWLDAYSSGVRGDELAELEPPFTSEYPGLVSDLNRLDLDPETALNHLNVVYERYLGWNSNIETAALELEAKRALLERILVEYPGEFSWIIDWANKLAYSERIQLKDYWRGGATLIKKREIPGAYTLTGKAAIDALLESMETISLEASGFDEFSDEPADAEALAYIEALAVFRDEYYIDYINEWEDFLINFGDGAQVLANQDDWQGFVENLRNAKNPFFLLLTDANNQLIDFVGTDYEPDWLYLIDYYNQVLALLGQTPPGGGVNNKAATKTAIKLLGKLGKGGKAVAKVAKSVQKTQKKLASDSSGPSPSEMELAMADVSEIVLLYQQSISDVVANSSKRLVSLAAMREHFLAPTDPGGGTTAYAQAWKAVSDIETRLGFEKQSTAAFWRIFKGPVIAAQRYLLQEATCSVQEQWQEQYLSNLDGVPLTSVPNIAFVEGGLLWAFYDAVLAPFMKKNSGNYTTRSLEGAPLSLNTSLFNYLNNGSSYRLNNQPFYQVFVTSSPISVNSGANTLPHEGTLSLICPEREFELVNNNFPSSAMMQWADTCLGFEMSIAVGRYVVKKQYPGSMGFPRFVRDFQTGTQRLYIDEFPEFEDRLAAMGIQYFDLNFRFRQQTAMLNRLETAEVATPPIVAQCWDLSTTTVAMEL